MLQEEENATFYGMFSVRHGLHCVGTPGLPAAQPSPLQPGTDVLMEGICLPPT